MRANLQTVEAEPLTAEVVPSSVAFPLTAERKDVFLTTLITTGGNVSKACRLLNISRQRVFEWRETDKAFDLAWSEALEAGTENLEEIAYRRACTTSDTLAIFLLKARRPNVYRENIKVESEVTVDVDRLAESLAASLYAAVERRRVKLLAAESSAEDHMGHDGPVGAPTTD